MKKKSVQYPGNYFPLGFTTFERQFAKVLNITIWRVMAKCWLSLWSSSNGSALTLDDSWRKLATKGRGSYDFAVNWISSWLQWWLYPTHVPVKIGMRENLIHLQMLSLTAAIHEFLNNVNFAPPVTGQIRTSRLHIPHLRLSFLLFSWIHWNYGDRAKTTNNHKCELI